MRERCLLLEWRFVPASARFLAAIAVALLAVSARSQERAATESGGMLEEIVVVAQKRSQNMQEVPVAVSVFSGDKIERSGMLTVKDLTDLQPSVFFDTAQSFQNSSLKIRGIGTFGNGRTFEGSVGVFVDGVYRARSGMVLSDLLDIEHLEIMRGSQGTLYGKNTVAGAIALVSNRPDTEALAGELTLRMGEFDDQYVAGSLNVPIDENMAFRISGNLHERQAFFRSPDDGYGYDALDRYQLKAQYLFAPSDDLEIRLIADFGRSDAACCWGSAQVTAGPLAPFVEAYAGLNGLSFVVGPRAEEERIASLNTHPSERVDDEGLAAYVDWNVGNATLRSITSVRRWTHEQISGDADFAPIDIFRLSEPADIDTFSQELTYANTYGATDLLLGFYYAKENYESTQRVDTGGDADNLLNALISGGQGAVGCLPPFAAVDCLFPTGIGALLPAGEFSRTSYAQDTDTFSIFAHAVTELAARIDLVTGLRWNVEEKSGGAHNLFWYDSAIVRAALEAAGIPDDGTPRNGFDLLGTTYSPSFDDATRDEELSGALTVQFSATGNTTIYGTYRRGYKAGGVNLFREAALTATQTYDPEVSDDLEAGMKTTFLSGRGRTNLAIFHTEFSDLQMNFFDGLNFRTENVGEASTRGLELEAEFQITEQLFVEAAATYLNARFDRVDSPFLAYLDGRDTPRAPELASVLGVSWERPMRGRLRLFVNGSASYAGSHYVGADVVDEQKVGSYVITRASAGVRSERSNWEALVWCTNCGDETYRTIYFNAPAQPGSYNAYLNDPQQYGATVRLKF